MPNHPCLWDIPATIGDRLMTETEFESICQKLNLEADSDAVGAAWHLVNETGVWARP